MSSSRLGRNPFGNKTTQPAAAAAPVNATPQEAQPQTPPADFAFAAPEMLHTPELPELSSLRDFVIRDVPAAALMLAIKGATRLIERTRH